MHCIVKRSASAYLKVEKFCKNEVEKALLEAEAERNDVQPKEPLIRLRINRAFKSGEGAFETFNLFRFGEQFRGMRLCAFLTENLSLYSL